MAKKSLAKKSNKGNNWNYVDILYEVKNQVAWVTINRPRAMNAFREQTLDELIDALKSTREDLCVPRTLSALISRKNRLTSAHYDRAAMFRAGSLDRAIQVEEPT